MKKRDDGRKIDLLSQRQELLGVLNKRVIAQEEFLKSAAKQIFTDFEGKIADCQQSQALIASPPKVLPEEEFLRVLLKEARVYSWLYVPKDDRPDFIQEYTFKSWLYRERYQTEPMGRQKTYRRTIAQGVSADYWKKTKKTKEREVIGFDETFLSELEPNFRPPYRQIEAREALVQLFTDVDLPDKRKAEIIDVLRLTEIEGYTKKQAAALLGLDYDLVRQHLHRFRQHLEMIDLYGKNKPNA